MESIQNFKYCPWISEEIDVSKTFDEYKNLECDINIKNSRESEDEMIRKFFYTSDDFETFCSRRNTPGLARQNGVQKNKSNSLKSNSPFTKTKAESSKKRSIDDLNEAEEAFDLFPIEKIKNDCSIDLLTVDEELTPREIHQPVGEDINHARLTNWFIGTFRDGLISDGGTEKLSTLAYQARELYKRETVKDYIRLRHRLLKYSRTVRMAMKDDLPDFTANNSDTEKSDEIIFNLRIYRPFHKKCFSVKNCKGFPNHSQELYFLGSQKLTDVRDAIICTNDVYVHQDFSAKPSLSKCHTMPALESELHSNIIYINGVLYNDIRHPLAADTSLVIKKWAKRTSIGNLQSEDMEATLLRDLNLRLGYPYVYQHLGNCEHLLVFTEIRLMGALDIQERARYPVARGVPIKNAMTCYACHMNLACWLIKDDKRLPIPLAHFCEDCLKTWGYTEKDKKIADFKVYPFIDEYSVSRARSERMNSGKNVHITIDGKKGPTMFRIQPMEDD